MMDAVRVSMVSPVDWKLNETHAARHVAGHCHSLHCSIRSSVVTCALYSQQSYSDASL